jgi:hypothetical protein
MHEDGLRTENKEEKVDLKLRQVNQYGCSYQYIDICNG